MCIIRKMQRMHLMFLIPLYRGHEAVVGEGGVVGEGVGGPSFD
jgi:hypothetical protein